MHAATLLSLAGVTLGANTTKTFEPDSFNVTDGLLGLGVDVGAIPQLREFVERRPSDSACSAACLALSQTFGGDAVHARGSAAHDGFTDSYWSENQNDVDPFCIFKPPNAPAVSVMVLLSRLTGCPFAVKSGGHAAFAGASSIEGGITVSLERLDGVRLCGGSEAEIGAGLTWADVYGKLAKRDLTVSGGRVSSVGVGGLSLGGGISFFSNIHGWACDNVVAFEVVTASGLIVTASAHEHKDLYWALRGGGNNFGIVTKFTFRTIRLPGGRMWGGSRMYLDHAFDQVAAAFSGVVADSAQDPNAGLWVAWLQNDGTKIAATELWYAKPSGDEAAIFDAFNAITPLVDTTENRTLVEYTDLHQESNPYGLREVYYGLTVKADPVIATIARDIFFEELPSVDRVAGANPVLIFQGITDGQMKHMSRDGGNPLGLEAGQGPLYLMHIACRWLNQADDAAIYSLISTVLGRIADEAKTLGLQSDYIYMNYASAFQDVIQSYGASNKARLQSIAAAYDPSRVFQRLQPGHFKLDRAPVPDSGYFTGSSM